MTNMANTQSENQNSIMAFLKGEAGGGVLLMLAAAIAMFIANSPWSEDYFYLLHAATGPTLSDKLGPITVLLWINDGLMAICFFLVGVEIKREFLDGRLSTWDKRRLPIVAAAAGMAVPSMVYLGIAGGDPALQNGWAIPAATDIAFAIGVLALLGKRAPTSLKLFLLTVAIVDDMGAVAIIAVAYTVGLKTSWLPAAAAGERSALQTGAANLVRRTYEQCERSVSRTARQLGISRTTVYRHLAAGGATPSRAEPAGPRQPGH